MRLFTPVDPKDELPPDEERGYVVEHEHFGIMYAWWVPEDKVWEDADECQYGPYEMDMYLKEVTKDFKQ